MDLLHERRMGDMCIITGNSLLLWALKAMKEKNNELGVASKYDISGTTFS